MNRAVRRKSTWGGRRDGAGRKPTTRRRHDSPHRPRPTLSPDTPVHVVLRVKRDLPRLRTGKIYNVVRRVLVRYLGRDDFRVIHLSIQNNHLHFLIEAANELALGRGMQSLAINAARGINAAMGRTGKVFAYRYHATQIRSDRQARHTLAYVLNNWRRHREDLTSPRAMAAKVDPYSSGILFDGWKRGLRFAIPEGFEHLPVSPPRTELLVFDWQRFGLIDPFETPGPLDVGAW